ncbi:hypothetical protein K3728_01180 [Rhodobacteraceae bacterium M385]|nr:hypothetical protein K3728_01180 [Rhodobacteraceae bacterium M385]
MISFGVAIIGARVLPPEQFSALITAAFLAKFMLVLNLGATAGYFVSRYSAQGPLAQSDPRSERQFLKLFLAQMSGLGLIVLGVASIWLHEYIVGASAFLLLVPLFVIEPALRYRRNFSFSLAPEFILSLALLSVLAAYFWGVAVNMLPVVYLLAIGLLTVALSGLALGPRVSEFQGGSGAFGQREFARVVALGGPVYLGTALFLVASSIDRLLLPLYGTDEQVATYFLAHQLTVGSMIFVTAINFVNTVNLGEARLEKAKIDRRMVASKLRMAALVALGSYLALILGVAALEIGFLPDDFSGITLIVSILGAGFSVFYISNAVTPLVAYYRRQMPLTAFMGGVAIALLANNAFVYLNELGAIWLASGTAVTLTVNAVLAIWYTFFVLKEQDQIDTELNI